jgi:hypothetical protein
MKMRIIGAVIGFIFASMISGTILMWNQGETVFQSLQYGLLYVFLGCGILQAISCDPASFRSAVAIQIGFAVFIFCVIWMLQRKNK